MKRKVYWTVIVLIAVLVIGFVICEYRRALYKKSEEAANAGLEARVREAYAAKIKDGACKKREDALEARVDAFTREAHTKLKIGMKKDAIIRFFAENSMPVTFSKNEASGTFDVTGCSPMGCGTDTASVRLRVSVDEKGSVISKPDVDGMYIDCP
ncbi:MAG: hypothetical protein ABSF70_00810 [Terracidiphilus sp.]|jgi:hypothetical protein